jgi:hypothetical protein
MGLPTIRVLIVVDGIMSFGPADDKDQYFGLSRLVRRCQLGAEGHGTRSKRAEAGEHGMLLLPI